jgi:hypothetical protein
VPGGRTIVIETKNGRIIYTFEDGGKVYRISNDENNNTDYPKCNACQRAVIMAIDLTGAEERKARAAGTQPVQPVQPVQPEEPKPSGKLTFDDLKKDPSVMQTIRKIFSG